MTVLDNRVENISKMKETKLIVLDFDGVITNNKVIVDQNGNEFVQCDKSDSLGIGIMKDLGIETVVISKERNKVVLKRCEKIGIECHYGVDEKFPLLSSIAKKRGLLLSQICYMGNDRNDIECMEKSGVSFAPNDAWPDARRVAIFVTERNGGDGAVREMCETIESAIIPVEREE